MKAHYQNVIVACCFLIMFINQGLPSTSFSVWQSYLVDVPGVGNNGMTAILLTRTLVSFVAIFFVSRYYRMVSLRRGVVIATVFTIAGFAAFGLAGHNLAVYCVGSVLAGVGYGFGGTVATTAIIGNWFKGDLGTAAGISGVGSGVASIVVPLMVAQIVLHLSLPWAFLAVAVLALILLAFVACFLRADPADMGLEPFVVQKMARAGRLAQKEAQAQADEVPHALPRVQWAMVLVAMALLGADAISASNYFSITLSTSGVDLMAAAAITALMGVSLTVSKFLSGKLFDIIGTFWASLVFFGALIVGAALCAFVGVGGIGVAAAAAVLFGAGCALSTTGLSVWSIEFSSPGNDMNSVRDYMIAYSFGGFVFNALPGCMKNLTGTYESSFIVFAAGSFICAVLVLWVLKRRHRRRDGVGALRKSGSNPAS